LTSAPVPADPADPADPAEPAEPAFLECIGPPHSLVA